MLSNDLRPETIEILTSFLAAFNSAHTNCEEAKHALKKDKESSEDENLTKQLGIQINQLKSKVADVNKALNFLDEEFTQCVLNTENRSPTE